jgi:RNA polymerase sigma-70 factor, ECF subfamily
VPEFALPLVMPQSPEGQLSSVELINEHFGFVWRLFRRLGLPAADADDATQQVFLVACTKLERIRAGSERSFLYGCALNHLAKWRASRRRSGLPLDAAYSVADEAPDAEQDLETRRARELLDRLLGEMPDELRTVFVLYELEELNSFQIGDLLQLPRGTVASRLRRAREEFERKVARAQLQRNVP